MTRQDPLLALCLPVLLGCTALLVEALTLAVIGFTSLLLCGLMLAALQKWLLPHGLTLAALLLGGTLLSCAHLLLQLHSYELASALQLFLPLLVLPCMGLARPDPKAFSGLRPGLLFAGLALVLGVLREGLGHATVFRHADWLFGVQANDWTLNLSSFNGFPLLTLAPGGFILLGMLLAIARLFSSSTHDRP